MGTDASPRRRAGFWLPGSSLCLPVGSHRGRGSNGRDTEWYTARCRSWGQAGSRGDTLLAEGGFSRTGPWGPQRKEFAAEESWRPSRARAAVPRAPTEDKLCGEGARCPAVWAAGGLRWVGGLTKVARRAVSAPLALAQVTAQGKLRSRRPKGPAGTSARPLEPRVTYADTGGALSRWYSTPLCKVRALVRSREAGERGACWRGR